MNTPSSGLIWGFIILPILVAAALPAGLYWAMLRLGETRRAAGRAALFAGLGAAAWMTATAVAAASGRLAFGPVPPPMMFLFVLILAGSIGIGLSRLGETIAIGVPLYALIGIQGFRLPLELLMHRAYSEGVMPVQMSYSGFNFDILTGITAIVVAVLVASGRMPLGGVKIWNWAGTALLANIVVIAWLSTPLPFRAFAAEPANVWITQAPFVWLPTVLVFAAILGHVMIFRRLRVESRRAARLVSTGPQAMVSRERGATVGAGH